LSIYDPLANAITGWYPFSIMMKVYYGTNLAFWGPIVDYEVDFAAGTMKLSAVDPTIRLQHHYVRYGDAAEEHSKIPEGNAYAGRVPVSGSGLRLLRDAGINTPGQDARGVPPLGIVNGVDLSLAAVDYMTVTRGSEVWSTMKELCSHA